MNMYKVTVVRSAKDNDPLILEVAAVDEQAVRLVAPSIARRALDVAPSVSLLIQSIEDQGEFNGQLAFSPSKANWALCRTAWEATHKLPSPLVEV